MITAGERLMYEVMKAVYESGIPIDFKGSMVLKACLIDEGYIEQIRHTVDIDANWYSEKEPTAKEMIESLQHVLDCNKMNFEVSLYRMYGKSRSAGFLFKDRATGELLFTMDIDVNQVGTPTKMYEIDGIVFRGVTPTQMLADKILVVSTDKVYSRIKDVVDLYYLSKVCEFDYQGIVAALKNKNRELGDFNAFLNHSDALKHAYDKFRLTGDVNKPPFDEIYQSVAWYISEALPVNMSK